jgi:hypothetical protein
VKLTPKRAIEIVKEVCTGFPLTLSSDRLLPKNKKPPLKGVTLEGARGSERGTTKSTKPSPSGEPLKTIPATRKYTSMAKKARVAPSGRKLPTKKAAAKRSGSKPVGVCQTPQVLLTYRPSSLRYSLDQVPQEQRLGQRPGRPSQKNVRASSCAMYAWCSLLGFQRNGCPCQISVLK